MRMRSSSSSSSSSKEQEAPAAEDELGGAKNQSATPPAMDPAISRNGRSPLVPVDRRGRCRPRRRWTGRKEGPPTRTPAPATASTSLLAAALLLLLLLLGRDGTGAGGIVAVSGWLPRRHHHRRHPRLPPRRDGEGRHCRSAVVAAAAPPPRGASSSSSSSSWSPPSSSSSPLRLFASAGDHSDENIEDDEEEGSGGARSNDNNGEEGTEVEVKFDVPPTLGGGDVNGTTADAAEEAEEAKDGCDDDDLVDVLRGTLKELARLSLKDYEWRSGAFKAAEADRMVEESVARMRGEDPGYVRPMDASDDVVGPLGRLERTVVDCLRRIVDEEGRRARRILDSDGRMVRPQDVFGGGSGGECDVESGGEDCELGPLGKIEKTVVDFLHSIKFAESQRVSSSVVRPMDAPLQGPLGKLEEEAVRILDDIRRSEELRGELQARSNTKSVVRPIDVPGPLGELEMAVSELFQAEKMRSRQRMEEEGGGGGPDGKGGKRGKIVRPMNAKYRGPLGEAELRAYETIKQLNAEEMERLRSIRRVLRENRPMEKDETSALGWLEKFVVGLFRAPQMLVSVFERVRELLDSEVLLPEGDLRKAIDEVGGEDGEAVGRRQDGSSSSSSSSSQRQPPPPPRNRELPPDDTEGDDESSSSSSSSSGSDDQSWR